MMVFTEGSLRFEFDDRWKVVKYDGPDPGDYRRNLMNSLEGTKAVDFVALCKPASGESHLFWIEVKDFRTHPRPDQKCLAAIVAQKTRDSIAGVMGFYRTSSTPDDWEPFVQALARKNTVVKVLFWVEERPFRGPSDRQLNRAQVQANEIKCRLKWLTTKVFVVGQRLGNPPDGLAVSDVPAAE